MSFLKINSKKDACTEIFHHTKLEVRIMKSLNLYIHIANSSYGALGWRRCQCYGAICRNDIQSQSRRCLFIDVTVRTSSVEESSYIFIVDSNVHRRLLQATWYRRAHFVCYIDECCRLWCRLTSFTAESVIMSFSSAFLTDIISCWTFLKMSILYLI